MIINVVPSISDLDGKTQLMYNTVMQIIKLGGGEEQFDEEKLCNSLRKSGVDASYAEKVCTLVSKKIKPGDSTTKIFREALRNIVTKDLAASARYSLRRAVDALGPTGFLFEQYVEALLEAHGYTTKRNVMMRGECVTHEVDIYAEKGEFKYLVEAKYRNQHTIKTHVDQVMYADARLMDIQRLAEKQKKNPRQYTMWVITNTKFTASAIKYAKCRDVKLVGWNYPREGTLETMIVRKKMYPITVLPSLSPILRDQCAKKNLILAQDLLPYSPTDLAHHIDVSPNIAAKLLKEARAIIG